MTRSGSNRLFRAFSARRFDRLARIYDAVVLNPAFAFRELDLVCTAAANALPPGGGGFSMWDAGLVSWPDTSRVDRKA
jgi:hypothetical protein